LHYINKDIYFTSDDAVFAALNVSKYDSGPSELSIPRRWDTSADFTNSVDVTFRYPTSISTSEEMSVWYNDGSWKLLGNYPATQNGSYMYVTATGLTDLGSITKEIMQWTLSEVDLPLPVVLSSFTATISAYGFIQLAWVTHTETNVSGFRIYRGTSEYLDEALLLDTFIPGTNTSQTQNYIYRDQESLVDGTYYYWLESADFDGTSSLYGPVIITYNLNGSLNPPPIPVVTGINNVFPNPFNPATTIRFAMTTTGFVRIGIYNIRGQLVRDLAHEMRTAGYHHIQWDGKDENGNPSASGIYYVRMRTANDLSVKKIVLSK